MNSHEAGCICVECESQLHREVAQLRQQRDELAAALGTFSLLAQRIDTQRGIICSLTNDRDIMTACEVIAEHLNTAADSASDPAAGLREHDERVTADKDGELTTAYGEIDRLNAANLGWMDRYHEREQQITALRLRAWAADADAMIAHRWFAEQFGEIMNGRDFAVKVPMATEELAQLKQQLAASQLREKEKTELLDELTKLAKHLRALKMSHESRLDKALTQPFDTAALEAYVAERVKDLRRAVLHEVLHQAQISAQGDLDFLIHWLVEQLGIATQQVAAPEAERERHSYMSTACQHALHERCRFSCKFCSSPCQCACHSRKQEAAPDALRAARKDGRHPEGVCGHIGCDCYEEAAPDA